MNADLPDFCPQHKYLKMDLSALLLGSLSSALSKVPEYRLNVRIFKRSFFSRHFGFMHTPFLR